MSGVKELYLLTKSPVATSQSYDQINNVLGVTISDRAKQRIFLAKAERGPATRFSSTQGNREVYLSRYYHSRAEVGED